MIILLLLIIYVLWRDAMPSGSAVVRNAVYPVVLNRSPTPDRTRLKILITGIVGGFIVAQSSLVIVWYRYSGRSRFHWFDDRQEWLQLDKAGHITTAYIMSVYGYELMRWAGLDNKRAALIGAGIGLCWQSSIEVMDGYSAKWGASYSDLGANLIGSATALTQYLLWQEQRISLKYQWIGKDYPAGELRDRARLLYGDNPFERGIKDYNALSLWASVNIHKFAPGYVPRWLNVATGYSTDNVYGGFQNIWMDEGGVIHDRSDLPRQRLAHLSLDADLPSLSSNNKAELGILKILNMFKVPFPRMTRRYTAAPATDLPSQALPGWREEQY